MLLNSDNTKLLRCPGVLLARLKQVVTKIKQSESQGNITRLAETFMIVCDSSGKTLLGFARAIRQQ
jgi:hypothetical protein